MSALRELRHSRWAQYVLPATVVVAVALLPFFRPPLDGFLDDCILALVYVTMALGLNLIVGFAVAALVYAVLRRALGRKQEVAA